MSPERRFGIVSVSVERLVGDREKAFRVFSLPRKFGNCPLFS